MSGSPGERRAVAMALGAAALFGATIPASKWLLGGLGTLSVAGLLYLGAAGALLPWGGGLRDAWRSAPAASRWRLAGAVVAGGAVAPVLHLAGLRLAPAASVSLWLTFETVATAALAWAFFREHLGARGVAAVALVIAAGVVLALPERASGVAAAVLVAGACLCWALDNNLTSLIETFRPAQVVVLKGLTAGAVNLGLGLALEGPPAAMVPVVAALATGALGYGVALALYVAALRDLGAARSQLWFASAPIAGLAIAWTLGGERVEVVQVLAAGLTGLGLWLLLGARHAHAHSHQALTHAHAHTHDDGHHTHSHEGLPLATRHSHPHAHEAVTHTHEHVPDLHHRHAH